MKYEILFFNVSEIRMGSPYNTADFKLKGPFVPDLTDYTFQDIFAISSKGNTIFLVQWDIVNNEPGFRVWKISSNPDSVCQSSHIRGCCSKVELLNDYTVTVTAYADSKEHQTILKPSSFHMMKLN